MPALAGDRAPLRLARDFAALYLEVSIRLNRALIISGDNEDLVRSGAPTSGHDLVLYLVARHAVQPMRKP